MAGIAVCPNKPCACPVCQECDLDAAFGTVTNGGSDDCGDCVSVFDHKTYTMVKVSSWFGLAPPFQTCGTANSHYPYPNPPNPNSSCIWTAVISGACASFAFGHLYYLTAYFGAFSGGTTRLKMEIWFRNSGGTFGSLFIGGFQSTEVVDPLHFDCNQTYNMNLICPTTRCIFPDTLTITRH